MTNPLMSRRSLLHLAGLGAGAAVLGTAGCGGSSGPQGDNSKKLIDIWCLQDPVQNRVQQGAVDRFTSGGGGEAKLTPFVGESYPQKLRVAMGSDQQPDVFFNWGGGSIRQYVQGDLLVDLTPTLDGDAAFKAKFLPAVLDAGKIGEKYYGVPLRGMQPIILYYNKDVLSQAGAQPPATWAQTLALVDTLKAAKITPFALAGTQKWTLLMWIEYLADRIGGPAVFQRIADGDKTGWQDPAMLKALDSIGELVDRGAFGTNWASVNYEEGGASTLFAQGKAAMHLMGSWEYTNQVDQQPEFAEKGLGWTMFPAYEGGAGNPKAIVGNPTNYFSITKASDDVEGATAFLKQEMASDAYVDDWIKAGDVPPITGIESRLAASPSPEFSSFVYGMVRDASSFQLSWDQAIDNKYAEPMLANLQKLFLGELDSNGFASAMAALA